MNNKKISKQKIQNETVLVTGANGFVGSHVVKQLLIKGYNVIGTVRTQNKKTQIIETFKKKFGQQIIQNLDIQIADLEKEENWENIIRQCTSVIHVATPMCIFVPKGQTKDSILNQAVQGTERILELCGKYNIQKVVFTSSTAAVSYQQDDYNKNQYTSKDWTPETIESIYLLQKTLSEKKAWQIQKKYNLNLTTICPGMILGPEILRHDLSSNMVIQGYFSRPIYMDSQIFLISVKDVAKAHVLCIENKDQSKDKRYILVDNTYKSVDMLNILKEEFSQYGYVFPGVKFPKIILKFFGYFIKPLQMFTTTMGRRVIYDNSEVKNDLNMEFEGLREFVTKSAYSLIENGKVENKICNQF